MNKEKTLIELSSKGIATRSISLDKEITDKEIMTFVATTENPVRVFDYAKWDFVDEVLLMSGFKLRKGDQVPFCDTHSRNSCDDVLGKAYNWRVNGQQVEADVEFANDEKSLSVKQKFKDGMLTDCSIGYVVKKAIYVPQGEDLAIEGKMYKGGTKVCTEWEVIELSATPVGADIDAVIKKGRSFFNSYFLEDDTMVKGIGGAEGRGKDTLEPINGNISIDKSSVDTVETVRKALESERQRVAEITAMTKKFKMEDKLQDFILDGHSIDNVRKIIMDNYVADNKVNAPIARMEAGEDARDKFYRSANDSLSIRLGYKMDKHAEGAKELAGYSLYELARECLRVEGKDVRGTRLDVATRALSTSDLANVLGNIANKSMNIGFESATETWNVWCDTKNVADFKTQTLVKLSESSDLERVYENGEYKLGTLSDAKETYALLTFGKEYLFGRHMIINDDLNALGDWMMAMGESAQRKLGDLVYDDVLTANPNMADGVALFEASTHKNLAGTSASPSITSIGAGILAMAKQTDIGGLRSLNIRPEYFIAPKGHELVCEQLFRSSLEGTQAKPNLINPYSGSYFTRVYDVRLDPSTGNLPWYLAGSKGKTVTVCFLEGSGQRPILERQQLLSTDGVKFRVTLDAFAFARDHRALYKNAGA